MEATDAESSRLRSLKDLRHVFTPTASHIYRPLREDQRPKQRTPWIFWLIVPFLMLLSVYFILAFSDAATSNTRTLKELWSAKDGRNVITNFKPVTFDEKVEFWDDGAAGDKAWDNLIPSNGGFLVEKDEKGVERYSGFSMFHQLHCLALLRSELIKAYGNKKLASASDQGHHHKRAEHGGKTDLKQVHWYHCLDYLRQGIICNADSTIERCAGDASVPVATGWNRTHQCRHTQQMWDFVRVHGWEVEEKYRHSHDHDH